MGNIKIRYVSGTEKIAREDLMKSVKNFSYISEGSYSEQVYVQYLCKFKGDITEETLKEFVEKVRCNEGLSENVASTLDEMAHDNVLDFGKFLSTVYKDDVDIEEAVDTAVEFLDMFDFGNLRIKTGDQLATDMFCAQMALFGNVFKDRRLMREYESMRGNTEIIELGKIDISERKLVDVKALEKKKSK